MTQLILLRENWGDAYTIGHDPVHGTYWAYRRDGLGTTLSHTDPTGLRRLLAADSWTLPVAPRYRLTPPSCEGDQE